MKEPFGALEALLYAVAAISGGLGASVIAGQAILRGRAVPLVMLLAYLVIGAVFGMLALAYGALLGIEPHTFDALVGNSILAGAVASITLASTNLSMRWVLRRFGVEVELTLRRKGEDRRRGD